MAFTLTCILPLWIASLPLCSVRVLHVKCVYGRYIQPGLIHILPVVIVFIATMSVMPATADREYECTMVYVLGLCVVHEVQCGLQDMPTTCLVPCYGGVYGVQWWVAGYFIRVSHGPHMRVCL